ncbi:MAG: hypothetical protein ACOVP1_14245 [Bacteroidia bacterium]
MKIHYLSYGKYITGGFLHEKFYAESLLALLQSKQIDAELIEFRTPTFFENVFEHFRMNWNAFWQASAPINILVSRYALAALVRSLFSSHKFIVVMHYEDNKDGNSWLFQLYFNTFYFLLNLTKPRNLAILTVAPFWKDYFKHKCPRISILYFPNLINPEPIKSIVQAKVEKLIHLGQWSWKNDQQIFVLAKQLKQQGYTCYFSTNRSEEAGDFDNYSIISEGYESYIKRMSSASYTIAFTSINEGWNRVAHESILCGTPVIGFFKGGLGDLLKESNSFIVKNVSEAVHIILNQQQPNINPNFTERYSIGNFSSFIKDSEVFLWNESVKSSQ